MTRTAPIRFKLPGLTRRLCVGARRRCRQNCARERNVYFALICMKLHSVFCPNQVGTRKPVSAHSLAPSSMPTISPVICRPGAAGARDSRDSRSFADIALHKYSAVCAGSEQRIADFILSPQSGLGLKHLNFLNIFRFLSSWHAT